MDERELFKILWLSKTTKTLKTFLFDSFNDDPQNKRCIFIDNDLDKVLTLNYDDVAWMITSPYGE